MNLTKRNAILLGILLALTAVYSYFAAWMLQVAFEPVMGVWWVVLILPACGGGGWVIGYFGTLFVNKHL